MKGEVEIGGGGRGRNHGLSSGSVHFRVAQAVVGRDSSGKRKRGGSAKLSPPPDQTRPQVIIKNTQFLYVAYSLEERKSKVLVGNLVFRRRRKTSGLV